MPGRFELHHFEKVFDQHLTSLHLSGVTAEGVGLHVGNCKLLAGLVIGRWFLLLVFDLE